MALARLLEPDWEWIHLPLDVRPTATFETMVAISVAYVVGTAILCSFMKSRKPFTNLSIFTGPHNLFMTVYSFYAFVGTVSILLENWSHHGFKPSIPFCDPEGRLRPGTDWWMYSFYISKFLEYLDSLFLILKGKSLIPPENSQMFLHVFHHATTASIVWATWRNPISVFWIGPVTNSFVHTIMYGYYFLVEFNLIGRSFGGKYITPIQLVQFIICMVSVTYETIYYKECGSDWRTIAWVYGTYLVFFVFFVQVYRDKASQRRTPNTATTTGATSAPGTPTKTKRVQD